MSASVATGAGLASKGHYLLVALVVIPRIGTNRALGRNRRELMAHQEHSVTHSDSLQSIGFSVDDNNIVSIEISTNEPNYITTAYLSVKDFTELISRFWCMVGDCRHTPTEN